MRMGVQLTPGQAAPSPIIETTVVQPAAGHELTSAGVSVPDGSLQTTSSPIAPVDPADMRPEWEKEIDDTLAKHGGTMTIPLSSGTVIKVTPTPGPAAAGAPVEVGYETFKRLSRAAAILNARVVNIVPKETVDAEIKSIQDKGLGYWASPHAFVEVEKLAPAGKSSNDFGIIASPKAPPTKPPIEANLWLVLSAASVTEQVPMRLSNGKVVGTLIKTTNGPMYARTARPTEHKLSIRAAWAMSGGYTIERELYDKYLTDPRTVIKVVREERVYLTTSAWIQQYGGLIKQWGADRIIMPLAGNFWVVIDKNGEYAG